MKLQEFLDLFKQFLDKFNDASSESDISGSLNDGHRVKEIIKGSPALSGQIATKFPCVFLRIMKYDQKIASLGSSEHRNVDFEVEIYPCVQYVAPGNGSSQAEDECLTLTDNIFRLLRLKSDLEMGADVVTIVDEIITTFNEEVGESTYVKMNKIIAKGRQYLTA